MNTPESPDIALLQQRLSDMEARFLRYQEMFPAALNRMDELDKEREELRAEVKRLKEEAIGLERVMREAVELSARQGEEMASLREAVWPGKPAWKPTSQKPQQDFSEAYAECLWSNNRLLVKIKALIDEDEEDGFKAAQELAENPIGAEPLAAAQALLSGAAPEEPSVDPLIFTPSEAAIQKSSRHYKPGTVTATPVQDGHSFHHTDSPTGTADDPAKTGPHD